MESAKNTQVPEIKGIDQNTIGLVVEVGLLPVYNPETGGPVYGSPVVEGGHKAVLPFSDGQLRALDEVDQRIHLVSREIVHPRPVRFETEALHRQSVAYSAGQRAVGSSMPLQRSRTQAY